MYKYKINSEIAQVSRNLEKHHSIFYKIWEFGWFEFNSGISTAALQFRPNTFKPLRFVFNPEFWNSLDVDSRTFIVAHECLHAILNHGIRSGNLLKDNQTKEMANIALDLAVNHMLVNSFKFNREDIAVCEQAYWVDKLFKDQKISPNLSFEEYYSLLMKEEEEDSQNNSQQSTDRNGSSDDKKNNSKNSDNNEENDSCNQDGDSKNQENNLDDQKNNDTSRSPSHNSTIFDDHEQLSKINIADLMQKMSNKIEKEDVDSVKEYINGSGCGEQIPCDFVLPEIKKMRVSKKWERIVKEWKRIGLNPPDDTEQWAKSSRRSSVLPSDIILPAYDESVDEQFCISKLNAWIFLDVSGSCIHLKDQFFMAYETISPKRFNKRMFIFADEVAEIDKKNKALNDYWKVGGGTNFYSIEQFVRKEIYNNKNIPDVIIIITDGDAYHPKNYAMPEKWHWFCEDVSGSETRFQQYLDRIDNKSHKHILKEFFVIQ